MDSSKNIQWEPTPSMHVVAHHAYSHQAPAKSSRRFLSFSVGEKFILLKKGSTDWWLAELLNDSSTSGYIPINHVKPVEEPDWLAGRISRQYAEEILLSPGTIDGSFLVRESEKKAGALSLSVRVLGGQIKHMKIQYTKDGFELPGVSPLQFSDVSAMLNYFETYPLSPVWGTLSNPAAKKRNLAPAPAPPDTQQSHTSSTQQIPERSYTVSRAAPPPPSAGAALPLPTNESRTAPPPPSAVAALQPTATEIAEATQPSASQPSAFSQVDVVTLESSSFSPPISIPTDITSNEPTIAASYPAEAPIDTTAVEDTNEPDSSIPSNHHAANSTDNTEDPQVNVESISSELIQHVRDSTSVSYKQARSAAVAVLEFAISRLQDPAAALQLLSSIQTSDTETALGGADIDRLQLIIEELTAMTNDAQQRSWSTHDDEGVIHEYLEEFISIVQDADFRAVKQLVATFQSPGQIGSYEIIETLVRYYQMETRTELRLLVLRLFGALGTNDSKIFPLLQNGVLPVELARDIMVNTWAPANTQRVLYSLLLCTMVFSCGLPMPINHYEVFNASFLDFLIGVIEHDASTDDEEKISEQATALLLAFNLHFPKGGDNMVVDILAGRTPQRLNQRLMLLINRNEDPVVVPRIDETSPQINSVLKFVHDIVDHEQTSTSFFYTNDLRVLIDVLIRELSDREPTDLRLNEYVGITLGIIIAQKMSQEEPYREDDLKECLNELRDGLETSRANPSLFATVVELLVAF